MRRLVSVDRGRWKFEGATPKTLANNLHIGEHTLRNHLSRIYDKLGVANRVKLYVFAQRHDPPRSQ